MHISDCGSAILCLFEIHAVMFLFADAMVSNAKVPLCKPSAEALQAYRERLNPKSGILDWSALSNKESSTIMPRNERNEVSILASGGLVFRGLALVSSIIQLKISFVLTFLRRLFVQTQSDAGFCQR
ncbi:hypothetical protein GE09DRAFT_1071463 [Coniochaeta sp. 2T2.1]|nr:hypothetical protein GE09DRAFT_1071463 [Coniochaeta sp. 2T2.1]